MNCWDVRSSFLPKLQNPIYHEILFSTQISFRIFLFTKCKRNKKLFWDVMHHNEDKRANSPCNLAELEKFIFFTLKNCLLLLARNIFIFPLHILCNILWSNENFLINYKRTFFRCIKYTFSSGTATLKAFVVIIIVSLVQRKEVEKKKEEKKKCFT